ncbi:M20 family metallopeptidase [Maribacter sp. HTCC2170]|uniref:M20 family metallopeptidase n=1 Tax=Maribacter sp. (strain HTCC2170 / KCCM 42371) TaxID=313603 RepID=UPI0002E10521|nr:M20 family metallopeptidase [Maribacter sp. HTCC2170]
MTINIAAEILAYFKANKDKMIGFLEKLVQYESPSDDPNSQKPILEFLESKLNSLGYFTLFVPGKNTGGFLYARPQNRDRKKNLQLLLGHCDTVWTKNTLLKMPISENNGKMTGPGVYDMKAGLTQILFSLKAIHEMSLQSHLTPVVLINSDEEIGSRESWHIIKRLSIISERTFVMEPPLGLEGKLKTARKGLGRFTITVNGKAAHAGLDPGKGINAIVELSHQVQKLFAMNDFDKGITVNVGTIQGGISPNVVAPESKAVIDVRVQNKEDGELITKQIYGLEPSIPDVVIKIEGGIGRPPMERTTRNQKLWQLAKTKALLLGLELQQATAGGGSDGNTTSTYTATLDGLGTTGDGAHALHEFIFLDQLPERAALLTLLLLSDSLEN